MQWLVACRLGGKNVVFAFATKASARAFARDCRGWGVETAIAKNTPVSRPKQGYLTRRRG